MRERVQVGPLRQAPSVQPTATPNINTLTVAPPKQSAGVGILKALSKIEPGLNKYIGAQYDKAVEEEGVRAYDSIQGMTFDEARQAVASGNLASTESPWFEAAFKKQFGLRYAAKRKREISGTYANGFDRDSGDIEEFLSGFVAEDSELYGGDKFVSAGIREGMAGFLENVRDGHAQYRSEARQGEASQGFLDVAREAATQAISKGQDVSAAVRSLYGPHREMLGVSFGQMDQMTLSLAEEFAEAGNKDAVNQLLTTEITGADGQKVGSFLSRAKFAKQAQRIKASAESKWAENQRAELFSFLADHQTAAQKGELDDEDMANIQEMVDGKIMSPGQASALLTQNTAAQERRAIAAQNNAIEQSFRAQAAELVHKGQGWAVTDQTYTDASGKERVLKAADIRQKTMDEAVNAMVSKGHNVASIAATVAGFAIEETYKPWEQLLSNGHLSISSALAKADEKGDLVLPEASVTAYSLFKDMSETPAFRNRHVKDSAALQTFKDAEVLERNGMDTEEALILAARANRKGARNGLTTRIDADRLSAAVNEVASFTFSDDAQNGGYVSSQIEHMARTFIGLGLSMNAAVDEAEKRFSDSHMIINGQAINHRDRALPGNFSEMAAFAIDEYAAFQGEDPDDFSLAPVPGSRTQWMITPKGPVVLPPNLGANANAFMSLSEITGRWQAKTDAFNAKRRTDANSEVIENKIERNTPRNPHFDRK